MVDGSGCCASMGERRHGRGRAANACGLCGVSEWPVCAASAARASQRKQGFEAASAMACNKMPRSARPRVKTEDGRVRPREEVKARGRG
jgi:hypothetical protein